MSAPPPHPPTLPSPFSFRLTPGPLSRRYTEARRSANNSVGTERKDELTVEDVFFLLDSSDVKARSFGLSLVKGLTKGLVAPPLAPEAIGDVDGTERTRVFYEPSSTLSQLVTGVEAAKTRGEGVERRYLFPTLFKLADNIAQNLQASTPVSDRAVHIRDLGLLADILACTCTEELLEGTEESKYTSSLWATVVSRATPDSKILHAHNISDQVSWLELAHAGTNMLKLWAHDFKSMPRDQKGGKLSSLATSSGDALSENIDVITDQELLIAVKLLSVLFVIGDLDGHDTSNRDFQDYEMEAWRKVLQIEVLEVR